MPVVGVLAGSGLGCVLAVMWARRALVRWEATLARAVAASSSAEGCGKEAALSSAPFSRVFTVVALVAGGLALAAVLRWQVENTALAGTVLVALPWVIALTAVDIRHRRLPDRFTGRLTFTVAVMMLLGMPSCSEAPGEVLVRVALGAGISGLVHLALAVLSGGQGMGLGDVKIAPSLAALLAWAGWETWLIGSLLPFLLGGVWGGVLLARGKGRRARLPFGPFMCAGTYLALLV